MREPLSIRMHVATKDRFAAEEVKKFCGKLDSFGHLASNVKFTYELDDPSDSNSVVAINIDFTCDEVEEFYMIHDDMHDKFENALLVLYVDPVNERIQQY